MGCDIVMGNVAPLMKRIQELEYENNALRLAFRNKCLDKSGNYVHYKERGIDTRVEGDHTDVPWNPWGNE